MDQGSQVDPIRVINILKQKNADLQLDNAAQQAFIEQQKEQLDALAERVLALEAAQTPEPVAEEPPAPEMAEPEVTPIKKRKAANE